MSSNYNACRINIIANVKYLQSFSNEKKAWTMALKSVRLKDVTQASSKLHDEKVLRSDQRVVEIKPIKRCFTNRQIIACIWVQQICLIGYSKYA